MGLLWLCPSIEIYNCKFIHKNSTLRFWTSLSLDVFCYSHLVRVQVTRSTVHRAQFKIEDRILEALFIERNIK